MATLSLSLSEWYKATSNKDTGSLEKLMYKKGHLPTSRNSNTCDVCYTDTLWSVSWSELLLSEWKSLRMRYDADCRPTKLQPWLHKSNCCVHSGNYNVLISSSFFTLLCIQKWTAYTIDYWRDGSFRKILSPKKDAFTYYLPN